MDLMTTLLIVWGVLTAVLIVLLIYRGTLTMHEDDQLFLDDAQAHMAKEQEEVIVKMNRVTPWVRIFGASSAVLIVVIAGLFVYSRISHL
jgi:hypothetical protein